MASLRDCTWILRLPEYRVVERFAPGEVSHPDVADERINRSVERATPESPAPRTWLMRHPRNEQFPMMGGRAADLWLSPPMRASEKRGLSPLWRAVPKKSYFRDTRSSG